jgi:MFS transporter, DHA3 family, tetracycline resistance protein
MTLFASLKHRPFALLWSGQTISRLGDSLYRIALAWWVLEKTGSATAMGTVLICSFAPMLIFLLLGGVAVDRFPRVQIMLASDLLRGLVALTAALLAAGQVLEIWHIYVASIVFGFVDAFFEPAYVASVPEITPPEALPSANSLTGLSRQITGIVGPSAGAAIVGLGGTPAAFAIDGLSFFLSAACLLFIGRIPFARVASQQAGGILRDLRAGLSTVIESPWLWVTIALAALGNVTVGGPMSVALPFLVNNTFRAGVTGLGLISSMNSLGAVIGSIWLGRATQLHHRGLIAYGGLAVGGLMVFAFGLPIGLIGAGVAALIYGLAFAAFGLIWTNTLQEMVPRDLLGRVSSIDLLGSFVLLPIGYGLAGWATDRLGAPVVFLIGGAASVGLALLGLAHPAIRNLD